MFLFVKGMNLNCSGKLGYKFQNLYSEFVNSQNFQGISWSVQLYFQDI